MFAPFNSFIWLRKSGQGLPGSELSSWQTMLVLLLLLTGYLTSKKRFFTSHSKPPSEHFQAVSTLFKEAGRLFFTASVCLLHTLGNFENVSVKIYKRLLQGELYRDHSSIVTGWLHCTQSNTPPMSSKELGGYLRF